MTGLVLLKRATLAIRGSRATTTSMLHLSCEYHALGWYQKMTLHRWSGLRTLVSLLLASVVDLSADFYLIEIELWILTQVIHWSFQECLLLIFLDTDIEHKQHHIEFTSSLTSDVRISFNLVSYYIFSTSQYHRALPVIATSKSDATPRNPQLIQRDTTQKGTDLWMRWRLNSIFSKLVPNKVEYYKFLTTTDVFVQQLLQRIISALIITLTRKLYGTTTVTKRVPLSYRAPQDWGMPYARLVEIRSSTKNWPKWAQPEARFPDVRMEAMLNICARSNIERSPCRTM